MDLGFMGTNIKAQKKFKNNLQFLFLSLSDTDNIFIIVFDSHLY